MSLKCTPTTSSAAWLISAGLLATRKCPYTSRPPSDAHLARHSYLVYGPQSTGANSIGFSLNMAVGFSGMILFLVRLYNAFEVDGNSLERIQAYTQIEQEEKPRKEGVPPAAWPTSGELVVEGLSARYSPVRTYFCHFNDIYI